MFAGFYQGRSVLITGHTGFKGSWLALWLHELGANVTGFALPPNNEPSHYELINLNDLVHHVEGDIRDLVTLQHTFDIAKPEIVFHLAAQALVRDSYDEPKMTFDTNIGGTVNILEAVRHCPTVKAIIIVTSDKCYENKEWVWGYRENDPLGGHDPYSASKGAAEIVCSSYRRSYFGKDGRGPHPGIATVRAGNVIGGGDWAKDRIIPDCVRSLSSNNPVIVRNPDAIRPWQHVLDPLSGYLTLGYRLVENREQFSGPWNFGPYEHKYMTVNHLVERFASAWSDNHKVITNFDKNSPKEASLLKLSIEKAVSELHWHPVLDISSTVNWTLEWYKEWNKKPESIKTLSREQIRQYVDKATAKGLIWTK